MSDRLGLFVHSCRLCVWSPSDWDVHTVQKSRDTQEPLQYERLELFVQAAEGFTWCRAVELLQLWLKLKVRVDGAFGSLLGGHHLLENLITSNCETDFVLPKD